MASIATRPFLHGVRLSAVGLRAVGMVYGCQQYWYKGYSVLGTVLGVIIIDQSIAFVVTKKRD